MKVPIKTIVLILVAAIVVSPVVSLPIAQAADNTTQAQGADNSDQARSELASHHGKVKILRDTNGVPNIYADNTYDLFYGYGHAIAQDRLFQLDMARRSATGTVAEVLGKKFLDFDKSIRSDYDPKSIQRQFEELSPKDKRIFKGYAAGYNSWVKKVKSDPKHLMPKEYQKYGFNPKPMTPIDVIMIFVGSMANRFSDSNAELSNLKLLKELEAKHGTKTGRKIFKQIKPRSNPHAPTTISPKDDTYHHSDNTSPAGNLSAVEKQLTSRSSADRNTTAHADKQTQVANLLPTNTEKAIKVEQGKTTASAYPHVPKESSVLVVGKDKTKGGNAILENGPQFNWFNPSYVYSVGLHGAGFNVSGNTPFGYPFILFGHNQKISWGQTAGEGDTVDIYQDRLNPSNSDQYLFKGKYRNFNKRTDVIKVKGAPNVTLNVYSDVHGIITKRNKSKNIAYAKRRSWAGHEVESLMAGIRSMQAKNHHKWNEQASKYAMTINWYYADRKGNIGYAYTGRFPKRPDNQDERLPAVGTGKMEWQGFQPFSDNPQVYNPSTGFITNWNNKPEQGYPDTDFNTWGQAHRVNYLADHLSEQKKLNANDIWDIVKGASYQDVNIQYFLPYLKAAVKSLKIDDPRRKAVAKLTNWEQSSTDHNRDGKYDSPETAIMQTWLPLMLKSTLKKDISKDFQSSFRDAGYPNPGKPATEGSLSPQWGTQIVYNALLGSKAGVPQKYDFFHDQDPKKVIRSTLSKALAKNKKKYGSSMDDWHLPIARSYYDAKNFWGVPQTSSNEAIKSVAFMNRGTENDLITMSDKGIVDKQIAPPGESGFIAPNGTKSKHYSDQLKPYNNWKLNRLWFTRSQVMNHLESKKTLQVTTDQSSTTNQKGGNMPQTASDNPLKAAIGVVIIVAGAALLVFRKKLLKAFKP